MRSMRLLTLLNVAVWGGAALAAGPTATYHDAKLVYNVQEKVKRIKVKVVLRGDLLVVASKADRGEVKRFQRDELRAIAFAYGAMPQPTAEGPEPFVASTRPGFLGGAHHWLVIQSSRDACALQLDDDNAERVVRAIEEFWGRSVKR